MDSQTIHNEVIVRTSVKHPVAKEIMMELNGKMSKILGKQYKVEFTNG